MGGHGRRGKPCKNCGTPLPCLVCRAKYKQEWAEANKERVRKQKDAYEARYPERVVASKRANYERNKERYNQQSRKLKIENKEEVNARYRRQYAKDPTPFIVRNKRRSERNKQVGGQFTVEDRSALFQIQRGLCANPYCQVDLGATGFHADHKTPVVRSGSHDPTNRQLLCPECNHRKGTRTNEEWLVDLVRENKPEAV